MLFSQICERLQSAGIESHAEEAALLLEKFCGISRARLPLMKNTDFESEELLSALEKRCKRYPLQYILGEWFFMNERYLVNETTLVPRPDTEVLVSLAIERLPEGAFFADLCTGSGCVAVSTLAARKDTRAVAVELFDDTLGMAKKNASLNGVSERFVPMRADVLLPLEMSCSIALPLDAILSNPPYIPTKVIDTLEDEVKSEPRAALDGGNDGLLFYREIIKLHSSLLARDGFFAFEIGFDQGEALGEIARENGFSCEIIKDYGGNDRVAFLKKTYNDN